jgi:hypothetical protein
VRFTRFVNLIRERVRGLPRVSVALVAASLVLSAPSVSGAGATRSNRAGVTTADFATIVLRGRTGILGRWRNQLRLKLGRGGIPVSFTVCGAWGKPPSLTEECLPAAGRRLPGRARMSLEQRRTTGWKRVGFSAESSIQAVLSDAVAGNRPGPVFYRVRLLQRSGRVLRTSNTFRVVWHR